MKKIIATALCLTLAAPCFAAGRFHEAQPNAGFNSMPRQEFRMNDNRGGHDYYREDFSHDRYDHHRASATTKTLGTIAGVAGVAAIISAIID